MITYKNLWNTMERLGITQYQLIYFNGFSSGQINRLKHDQYVSTHTIERLCEILNCSISEIMEYKK